MKNKIINYVAYIRVSAPRQGQTGLGLADQQQKIEEFIKNRNGLLIRIFIEVETGTNKRRMPELCKALELCKHNNSTLIVSRLNRLSRNFHFLSLILDSPQNVVFCDQPDANKTVLQIMAAIAEQEVNNIQTSTKAAIQQSIARRSVKISALQKQLDVLNKNQCISAENKKDIKRILSEIENLTWGNKKYLTDSGRKAGTRSLVKKSLDDPNNKKAFVVINLMKNQKKSLRFIANTLNDGGYRTSSGSKYYASTVKSIADRYKNNPNYKVLID